MIVGNKETPVRFSFVQVWEPKAMDDGDPKYSVQVVIPKDNKALIAAIEANIEKAKQLGITKGLYNRAATDNAAFRTPLRDGDQEAAEKDDGSRDYLKGCMFFNASSSADRQPAIVDRRGAPIMRRDDFYSGCYGIADINFYPFKYGKGGVAAGLNSIMKREDGERLDGRLSTDQAFGQFIEEDEAPEQGSGQLV